MGLRGELFSTRVLLQNRTYFFNVKENRLGDLYLNIVESKNREDGGFDRQSVILFADDLQEFLKGFDDSLRVLEKEIREKRRSSRAARGPRDGNDSRGDVRGDRGDGVRDGGGRRPRTDDRRPGSERPPRERTSRDGHSSMGSGEGHSPRERPPSREPKGGRRVVVRKR
ncbi:MAG: DUF3276 family protein [Treponema sp.]|nr:DUF3276 family protein [Treponema sp.]